MLPGSRSHWRTRLVTSCSISPAGIRSPADLSIRSAALEGIVSKLRLNRIPQRLIDNRSGTRQPSLLAGMVFDGDGNRMTPSHAVKNGTRYRYYVSRPLITKAHWDRNADADHWRTR